MRSVPNPFRRLEFSTRWLLLGLAAFAAFSTLSSASAQTGSKPATSRSQSLPSLTTKVAFPELSFDRPVALAYPDDGSNLLFVNEQHQGKVWSFPDEPGTKDKKLFLQLPDKMSGGNEEGLLGLAFHPKYKENGRFFVYYSANDSGIRHSVVSEFHVSQGDKRKADPSSEKRIWVSAADPFENHNGGMIAFGPDGMLFISLGDGGAADDPLRTGQKPSDWFASILRIDVDHVQDGKTYGIPADNPALRSPKFARWAPEVYCIGLRNVWRFSFDRKTGELWAGDVGQNLWEMVHRIENGGNYGWSIREGFHPFNPQRRLKADPASKFSPPLAEYPHAPTSDRKDFGLSITGGYVYRGKALPALTGVYVYGDFETGRIWGLKAEEGKNVASGEIIDISKSPRLKIASFGETPMGEILILAFDGKIHSFAPSE